MRERANVSQETSELLDDVHIATQQLAAGEGISNSDAQAALRGGWSKEFLETLAACDEAIERPRSRGVTARKDPFD